VEREPFVLPYSLMAGDRDMSDIAADLIAAGTDVATDGSGAMVLFAGEQDSEALLTDPRFGAVAMQTLAISGVSDGPLLDLWSQLMFGKDGDEHKRIRGAVQKHFTPAALAPMEAVATEIARELAGALPDGELVDLWDAYALPLASRTQCRLVGIPEDDALRVAGWALALVKGFGVLSRADRERAEVAAVEFTAYIDDLLAAKRDQPGDDIVTALLRDSSDTLNHEELRALVANLMFGGLEAITKAVLKAIIHLVDHGLWDEVTDPATAAHAVTELLRYDPMTTSLARLAVDEVDVGGTTLQPGQLALVNLYGVCRDERRYDAPDELRIDRTGVRPYAFGAGAHFCLGHVLAKTTIAAGLTELARRAPRIEVTSDRSTWTHDPFHGPTSLPARIG
jgi:cytochrome P450